ncbi:MAG: hypothetical protein ACOX0U_08385 [Oscillospiraceae bacterium]|jgi:hypothetical protein
MKQLKRLKRLKRAYRAYRNEMNGVDVSLLKCCLCALGAIFGLHVPVGRRGAARAVAKTLFWAAGLPLLIAFLCNLAKEPKEKMIELHFVAREKDMKDDRA